MQMAAMLCCIFGKDKETDAKKSVKLTFSSGVGTIYISLISTFLHFTTPRKSTCLTQIYFVAFEFWKTKN